MAVLVEGLCALTEVRAIATDYLTPSVSIHVGHVDDGTANLSTLPWKAWSRSSNGPKLLSSFAPHHSPHVYQLASLVSPLLASILDKIDLKATSAETQHRVLRLYDLIVEYKLDVYLDLLQIGAYHTPQARSRALGLLFDFWPDACGHLTSTRPLSSRLSGVDPLEHEFVPWRFGSKESHDRSGASVSCDACRNELTGFGLRCSLCPSSVHVTCYDPPSGSFLSEYPPDSDRGTHRIAVTRFSRLLPRQRDGKEAASPQEAGHLFRTVSLPVYRDH